MNIENIEVLLFIFAVVGVYVYLQFDRQRSISDRMLALEIEVKLLQQAVHTSGYIENQVYVKQGASDSTIKDLKIVDFLADSMSNRLTMEELKDMDFALELNGSIDWATQKTAVRTILIDRYNSKRLSSIIEWLREKRPDIIEDFRL